MKDQITRFLTTFGVSAVQSDAAATAILANPAPAHINTVLTPMIADDTRRAQAVGGILNLGLPPAATAATGTTTGTTAAAPATTATRHSHPWAWAIGGFLVLGAVACSIVLPLTLSDDTKADKADIVALDDKINAVDSAAGTRLATIDGKVNGFGTRLATAEGNLTTLTGTVATIDGKVTGFGTRLATAEGNLTTPTGTVATIDGAVTGLDTRVTLTEGGLTTALTDSAAATTRSNAALRRLAALRKEVAAAKAVPVVPVKPLQPAATGIPQARIDLQVTK